MFNENSSATGSETCWARIGNVKSTAALGLPKNIYVTLSMRIILEIMDDPKVSMSRILGWRVGFRSEMDLGQNGVLG